MIWCGLAALWSPLLMDNRSVCWELRREPERHPEGCSFRVTSEAAAALFVLLQLEDVSGHKG